MANNNFQKIIEAKSKSSKDYFHRLWNYRGLIWTFTKRDLKVQYAQTVLGIFTSILQPLICLAIFYVFFTRFFVLDTSPIPYPLFAFSGIIIWFYFTYIIGHCGNILNDNRDLIQKIYFPKLILPLSKILNGGFEHLLSLFLLIIALPFFGIPYKAKILLIPLVSICLVLTGLSFILWLSALSVKHKDFNHIIPYAINFGIWLVPVFYPLNIIPNEFLFFAYLNPITACVESLRWCLFEVPAPNIRFLLSSIPVLFLLVSGFYYFKETERITADFS